MTLQQFLQLPLNEQEIFKAKLIHVFNKNENFFMYAEMIVEAATEHNFFKHVKFGSDVYKTLTETEQDLLTQELSFK